MESLMGIVVFVVIVGGIAYLIKGRMDSSSPAFGGFFSKTKPGNDEEK